MIIPQDAPRSDKSSEPATRKATETDIPPPAYEPASVAPSGAPPHIQPANFIAISRRFGEVKDTFVLDPTLRVPHAMRVPPMRVRHARRVRRAMRGGNGQMHLSLSALMGEVSAEVYVVSSETPQSGKTRMVATSIMGTIRLQLHAPAPRAPISVYISARMGEANLLLPRSFRGPLRISVTLGEVEMSAALRIMTTTFGDGRVFVGAWTQGELEEGVWAGDEAVVDSKLGSVYVGYDDEDLKATTSRVGSSTAE
ncbi:hypothetical protein B0H17DRAFT_1211291 [Mycena rosella]|uniref:DUF7330 domain-containing protein n=1 Tax=Mycena rosella TaxID=1033263 RepID=A0AAD7CUM9_MYCRO|nr:hypothetical protein B0H17DRAFT_1211291 [Mycena rosella]